MIEAVLAGNSPQKNYQQALELALERAKKARVEDLELLGVEGDSAGRFLIPSLGGKFEVDLVVGRVGDCSGGDASVAWAILVLHYLASRPGKYGVGNTECISFMDIPEARGYAKPYQGRVINRFLHTAGKEEARFRSAAAGLAGVEVADGNAAFEFLIFPRARVQVIWYGGDEEVGPGASFSFAREVAGLFCVEDIVVMAELLVSALSEAGGHSAKK